MQITFINLTQAIVTALALGFAIWSYFKWVRPLVENTWAFVGFYGKILPWLKARWDIVCAFVIAISPILWNLALDILVGLSLLLEHILPAVAGLDLSKFIVSEHVRLLIPIAATVVPALRRGIMEWRGAKQ